MTPPVDITPCDICGEGPGRFVVHRKHSTNYVCSGCFIRREDHLRLTGKDLLDEKGQGQKAGPVEPSKG